MTETIKKIVRINHFFQTRKMTISLQLYLKPIQQNSQFETSNIHWVTQILGLEKKIGKDSIPFLGGIF